MRVVVKGVHSVRVRLAGGKFATYRYAWRGGPRLVGEPGTPEFMASYHQAVADRRVIPEGTLFGLIASYKLSSAFTKKADRTRKDYLRYLAMIEEKFGRLPLAALEEPEVRGIFMDWRDEMATTPRKADLAWSVLARVLSVAKDRGRIRTNPCERGGRLYEADRSDCIWTDDMVQTALATFPKPLTWVLGLALWTGQREGDLLRLSWRSIHGDEIRLKQGKTGRRIVIPIQETLRGILGTIPKRDMAILTSSDRTPWTNDGFRASWRRACQRAGIEGVTFHDLRGTAVTRLSEAGATPQEIATITGHSINDVAGILDRAYLSRTRQLGDNAITRLEANEKRLRPVKTL